MSDVNPAGQNPDTPQVCIDVRMQLSDQPLCVRLPGYVSPAEG